MKRIVILLTLAGILLIAAPARAQGPITVSANNFTNNFPLQLVFQLEAQSAAKITEVVLVSQVDGVVSSNHQLPEFTADTLVKAKYQWNLRVNYLPPGAGGQYWWTIQDEKGNKLETPKQPFRVDDRSQAWKKMSNERVTLYYTGTDNLGKILLERATEVLKYLEKDTAVTLERQVQIFVYNSSTDFFRAVPPGKGEGLLGEAFSDNAVVVMYNRDNDLTLSRGTAGHETTHLVFHAKISSPLGALSWPTWLDEGLAMYYEFYPEPINSDYQTLMRRRIQADTLIPIRSLSGTFPSNDIDQAYGESYSIVDFIYRHYGREKMAQLLQTFKAGGFYDDVLRQVFGFDADGLENEWRKDIGAKPRTAPTRDLRQPTVFPTFSLSTDATPEPRAGATATPQSAARNVTPGAPATSAPPASANPSAPFCGGALGLIALGIFGAMKTGWARRMRMETDCNLAKVSISQRR